MATPTPNPLYFACFPLQEYFVNKDTGFPLAGGYVEFFSDPAFTVPKDVFQQSLVGGTTYDYTNLGSVLVLSSVGTFVDNNGDDIIPFLYPYDAQGDIELYFVRVWSGNPSVQGSVLQFTRQGWPPNLIQSTSPSDIFESSLNLFTNPQFSIVNFNNTSGQTYYEITVAGAGNFEFAPGWSIYYAGAGSLKIGQYPLSADWPTNPSYYLEVISDAGVTPITLRQKLDKSPRVFENNYLSVGMLAACANNIAEVLTIDYVVNGGAAKQVLSATVPNNSTFGLLAGVANAPVLIDLTNNTAPDTGYVEMQVSVPSGRTMRYTSMFGCTVQNATSLVSGSQSTNAQQTNGMFWYYKPQLEYKPIPSYTLGWNWPINPCQELGTTVAAASNTPGFSRYVADETIVFQNVDNTIACGFNNAGMGITPSADTSFAIIKYFSGAEVANILSTPLSVQLKAGGAVANASDLITNVSIWYTFDASLPDLKSPNFYSLVSSVDNTTGVATVGGGGVHGTWYEVPRSGLGAAIANLKTSNVPVYNFNGWVYNDVTPATSVKYCAIVISVSRLTAAVGCTFEYCTLNSGYIPTRPQADSFGENLQALQQYYEKSYNISTLAGAATFDGAYAWPLSVSYTSPFGVTANAIKTGFSLPYKATKRASAIPVVYSTAGTQDALTGILTRGANENVSTTYNVSTNYTIHPSVTTTTYQVNSANNNAVTTGAWDQNASATAYIQWVVNARLGIV